MPRPRPAGISERQKYLRKKAEDLMDMSKWPFLTAVVFHYNMLAVDRQKEMGRRYNKMSSSFVEEGRAKFTKNSDTLMKQALMAAMSRYYPELAEKSIVSYMESYIRSKNSGDEL
jgi:hypothetical protein